MNEENNKIEKPWRKNIPRGEDGKYIEPVPSKDIAAYVNSQEKELITRDISEHFCMWTSTAYAKLNKLADDGIINRRMAGHTIFWSRKT